jgi:hypothetical protein
MSTPFIFSRIHGGEIDPQFDRHIRKKGNAHYFSHEKYNPKACIGVL